MRDLTLLQDRIGAGDEAAFRLQPQVAAQIAQRLKTYPPEFWKDVRNRLALIKFALSGGDPEILRTVAEKQMFTEADATLARGVLAYAEGFREQALGDLDKVDVTMLGPSLAGHVALVKAILAAETDPVAARQASLQARWLSPGTLVEEAALRLAIEIDIQLVDGKRFETDVARYLRRFPASRFAPAVLVQVGSFTAFWNYSAQPIKKAWVETVATGLELTRRAELFVAMAEYGIRYGRLATAAFATGHAAASGADRATILAYEGAAQVVNIDPANGLVLLASADAFGPDAATSELISAARIVGELIRAPTAPASVSRSSAGEKISPKSARSVKAEQALAAADKLMEETVQ